MALLLAGQLQLVLGHGGECNTTNPCPCPCTDASLCRPLAAADQPRAGADHVVAFSAWEFAKEPKTDSWTGPLHFNWGKITVFAPFDNIDRGRRVHGQTVDQLDPYEAMYLVSVSGARQRIHHSITYTCACHVPVIACCWIAGYVLPGAQTQGDDPHQRLHQLGWHEVPCQRFLQLGTAV